MPSASRSPLATKTKAALPRQISTVGGDIRATHNKNAVCFCDKRIVTPSITETPLMPRTVQFGCMLQRGYYPTADERLRGTFVLAVTQDPLPISLGAQSSTDAVRWRDKGSCFVLLEDRVKRYELTAKGVEISCRTPAPYRFGEVCDAHGWDSGRRVVSAISWRTICPRTSCCCCCCIGVLQESSRSSAVCL